MSWFNNMMPDCELVFSGEQDDEDWMSDVELWMLSMRMVTDKAKSRAMPVVMQGKAKAWFEGLEVPDRQSWKVVRARFIQDFKQRILPTELDAKLKVLKQDVSGEFTTFFKQFEDSWQQLEAATQSRGNDYFKLERFLECLHPKIREKVELVDMESYADAVSLAKAKSRKAKKKLEMGLLKPTDYGYSSTTELRHAMKPKGSSSVKEVAALPLVRHSGRSFQFVPPVWYALVQESVSPASSDAVLIEACMHEESNEARDQGSQDTFEDVGKAMVEAVQKEASQGVGQPCPTDHIEERQCIPEGVGDVNIPENEVIDHGFLSHLADDMVVEEVLEEQAKVVEQSDFLSHEVVEDEASQVIVHKDWHGESGIECVPFEGPTVDGMLEEHVGLILQEAVVVEDRLPKVGVMLLMDMLLKAALQTVFHGLQSSRDERYAMESSHFLTHFLTHKLRKSIFSKSFF
ncbi:hypothetical protein GOP47_0025215, partial [Adiantum capillus-veneris]